MIIISINGENEMKNAWLGLIGLVLVGCGGPAFTSQDGVSGVVTYATADGGTTTDFYDSVDWINSDYIWEIPTRICKDGILSTSMVEFLGVGKTEEMILSHVKLLKYTWIASNNTYEQNPTIIPWQLINENITATVDSNYCEEWHNGIGTPMIWWWSLGDKLPKR